MEKNTLIAVVASTLFLILWWTFFQPTPKRAPVAGPPVTGGTAAPAAPQPSIGEMPQPEVAQTVTEREITVDGANYRAVFTTLGAGVKHWYIKEKNGTHIDLVLAPNAQALSTYPNLNYTLVSQQPGELVFSASAQGLTITKRYTLSENYLHSLQIQVTRTGQTAFNAPLEVAWDAGLGTDPREQAENLKLTRALGFPLQKPHELKKLKPGEYSAADFQWFAIDNRYFLLSFILAPQNAPQTQFDRATVTKPAKNQPPHLAVTAALPATGTKTYSMQFYLGPKGYSHLKTLGLRLEETVDFGFFGFLGKLALGAVNALYGVTKNYGWAIVLLTIGLQILVFPLSMKSFKASIAMKKLQPHIKALQEKYKNDPQRLNMEMLNLYKTQKVNPLGGCLPMILQLPIFWALFTTLRNAYELRGAPWILWVKDLSAPDTLLRIGSIPLNVLPLIMGVGMFFQQKLMSVTTDPAQARMMYLMPVIFTFIFWNFPSGLVLYWLVNNILTVSEQYLIMNRQEQAEVA